MKETLVIPTVNDLPFILGLCRWFLTPLQGEHPSGSPLSNLVDILYVSKYKHIKLWSKAGYSSTHACPVFQFEHEWSGQISSLLLCPAFNFLNFTNVNNPYYPSSTTWLRAIQRFTTLYEKKSYTKIQLICNKANIPLHSLLPAAPACWPFSIYTQERQNLSVPQSAEIGLHGLNSLPLGLFDQGSWQHTFPLWTHLSDFHLLIQPIYILLHNPSFC